MTFIADVVNSKRQGHQVWALSSDRTVREATWLMARERVGAVPIVEKGRVIGMFTERDVLRLCVGESSGDFGHRRLGQVMTPNVIFVKEDATLEECLSLMTKFRVRHLPVLDGKGDLAGIISIGDLVKSIVDSKNAEIGQLENYITNGIFPRSVAH